MKKVLFIAYHFPPGGEPNSLRAMGISKKLFHFGWEPIILTVRSANQARDVREFNFKIVETDPSDVFTVFRKIFRLKTPSINYRRNDQVSGKKYSKWLKHIFKAFIAFPDRNIGWYPKALRAANNIVREEKIDLILSTSSPWTSALIARKLCVKHDIPWIADFHDLWSQNHRKEFKIIRPFCDKLLEKWTLKKANSLIIVSKERAIKLRKLHKKKAIHALTLGFNAEVFETIKIPKTKQDKFVISYAGKIKGCQDPEPFFIALKELIAEGKIVQKYIQLNIWGEAEQFVHEMIQKYELGECIFFKPRISWMDILIQLKSSAILLNLSWNDPDEKGIHPGKLFDYLGAKRPILSIGSQHEVVAELLSTTNAGIQLWKKDDIKKYLIAKITEFKENGTVSYAGITDEVNHYDYFEITGKLAQLMDEAIIES